MYHLAIFGGTFDPVHYGHLKTSMRIQSTFHFEHYAFLPCKVPTMKAPACATAKQRVQMLELAIAELNSGEQIKPFHIDLRELKRDTPSYIFETLQSLRTEHPSASLILILGADAFYSLPQWHRWEDILPLCNLLVIQRPLPLIQQALSPLDALLRSHQTKDQQSFLNQVAGMIYFFDAGHYEISSSMIREQLTRGQLQTDLLPEAVYSYIIAEGLYYTDQS